MPALFKFWVFIIRPIHLYLLASSQSRQYYLEEVQSNPLAHLTSSQSS